ncbi:MAG: DUF1289 domain-containing protein [Colwelliaceae bacterium]|nr:DUF1289 domain-containing protein [Colwelliaceae bacterium]
MQLEFFDVPSPCIGVCQSNDKGQCLGCFRTRDERQQWINLSSDDKQKVIKRCLQRKKRKESKIKIKEIEQEAENKQPSLLDPPSKNKLNTSNDMDFGDFEL